MRRVVNWGAALFGAAVLAGWAATPSRAGSDQAPPTVTVYKTPT
jgi:hypothetical protein